MAALGRILVILALFVLLVILAPIAKMVQFGQSLGASSLRATAHRS
jgi:hypothetical protein